MSNRVLSTPYFEVRLKRFLKKHPSLSEELTKLEAELISHPDSGISLGSGLYKIRLKSEKKGKSGSFRIITYLVRQDEDGKNIYLITIYSKNEESNIDKKELKKMVERIFSR
jgi:hypothetical protein